LYGRWPHSGVWLCLLSQCDRFGHIDMVPRLLAAKIGVGEDLLLACIRDFMEPDPGSRTGDLEGRRLELIDPDTRDWGWRVINHGLYREKARKAAYDAERTQSGADAERKRKERENQGKVAVPRSPDNPDVSRDFPPSDSDSDSDSNANSNQDGGGEVRAARSPRSPLQVDFELTTERKEFAIAQRVNPTRTFDKFVDHFRANGAASCNWDAAWRKWCRAEAEGYPGKGKPPRRVARSTAELEAEEAAQNAKH
jgi:hypothetical protein